MSVMASKPLGQILKQMGKISEFEIQEALQTQKSKGGALGTILKDNGHISDVDLHTAIGMQSGLEPVDLDSIEISPEVIRMVDANMAETYRVIPVAFDNGKLGDCGRGPALGDCSSAELRAFCGRTLRSGTGGAVRYSDRGSTCRLVERSEVSLCRNGSGLK